MEATADLLKEGQKATIAGLKDGDFSQKLAEMGCVPGTEIVKLYTAPGGDPIAFRIDSYILGLRKSEAENIFVKVSELE
jgi:ferrous iron transport protein A